jgi:hypothetical protein
MPTSTKQLLFSVITLLLVCLAPLSAYASRPTLAVAPMAHSTPKARAGLAAALSRELEYGGHFDIAPAGKAATVLEQAGITAKPGAYAALDPAQIIALNGLADYILFGEVAAFDVVTKDAGFDLGRKLSDLGRRSGLSDNVAQVVIDFKLMRVSDGLEVLAFSVEGQESRHGVMLDSISQGWLSSANYESDEFRRTNLGLAFYKAVGQTLYELYAEFPLEGSVLAVTGDSVIIDLDQRAGVQAGDEIVLMRETSVPNAKGDAVWRELERTGSAKVLEFQPGRCLCLVLEGAGQIAEGDIARPLAERLVLPIESDREELP